MRRRTFLALALTPGSGAAQTDPLPSWNEGASKRAVVEFVAAVTKQDGAEYNSPAERNAVFDNDGTLWSEQPRYFPLFFAIDRVKALAPHRPECKERQPFKAALEDDTKALAASGEKGLAQFVTASGFKTYIVSGGGMSSCDRGPSESTASRRSR